MDIKWEDNSTIKVRQDGDVTVISANKEGLVSLAHIMLDMAKEDKDHIHLDENNSLEDESNELIIEKM